MLPVTSPLSRRVLLFLLAVSSLVAAALITVELSLEYRRDLATVDSLLAEIETSRLPAIAETVWVANDRLIESQLNGLVNLTVIESARIASVEGAVYQAGSVVSSRTSRRTFAITYPFEQTFRYLGTLEVVIGLDGIHERTLQRLATVGLAQLVKTLIISALAFLILWYLVVRHVRALTRYADRLSLGQPAPPMLSRRGRASHDEFDDLSEAIVAMADRTWQMHQQFLTEARRRHEAEGQREIAEEASQAKSVFLANMSHELRTPLNCILGFSEILGDQPTGPVEPDRAREYGCYINRAGQHLLNLVNDILEFSEIDAGRKMIKPTRLSVARLLSSVMQLHRGWADGRKLALHLACPPDLPELWADEQALKRVLLNLLSNAIKFTLPGGHITVSARLDGEGRINLMVEDTGIGIPAEQIERVLQPFEQVEHTYSRSVGGTGLGLPLAKGLVELHGGSLKIDSQVGTGTRITLLFPPERTLWPSERQAAMA